MTTEADEVPVGYAALLRRFSLPTLWLARTSSVGGGTMRADHRPDGRTHVHLLRAYHPGDTTVDHLIFALKYEGVDLRVMRAVLAAMPAHELGDALRAQPTGQYLRRLWFLYEWLLDARLDLPDLTQGNYIPLLDPARHVTGVAWNSRRHRVRRNTLSPRATMCPMVSRTPLLARQIEDAPRLDAQARALLEGTPPAVLWRATAYLFDKETRSTYAIERETPREGRAERFVRALREASEAPLMSRALLVRVQNAIVDEPYAELRLRAEQNWVGRSGVDFHEEVFLLPPVPEALPELVDAWIELANHLTRADDNPVPPVVGAAVLAFGFVYLHPFHDGNGRLHRWLIHWALARRGFVPRGVVLPISAAILRDPLRYDAVLERISRPIRESVPYEFRGRELALLEDHHALFRHLDLTAHAEALGEWFARTVERELAEEVLFIERFDRAVEGMRAVRELPDRRERLFVQLVVQNAGRLSARKRAQFAELDDDEIASLEAAVRDGFELTMA